MSAPCSQRLEYSENGTFHIWRTKTKKKSNQSITVKDVTYSISMVASSIQGYKLHV